MDFTRDVWVAARSVVFMSVFAMTLPIAVFGQADSKSGPPKGSQATPKVDLLIGAWKVNFDKSVGPPRQRDLSMTIEKAGNGRKWTVYIVAADGTKSTRVSPANDDGKEYPVTGHDGSDAIILKRVDAFKWEETLKKGGKPVFEGTWVLSKDGKTLTIASSKRKYARVYEKQ